MDKTYSPTLKRLIARIPIYELCNYCPYYIAGKCRAKPVTCTEEIEKQVIKEIRREIKNDIYFN